jgi:hypothetical protein
MALPYALPADVVRKLDDKPDNYSDAELERFVTRSESASQEWDQTCGTPMRTVRRGAPGAPETYEHHDAEQLQSRPPVRIDLDRDNIVPIDPQQDTVEIRVGRDTWRDISDKEGETYIVDYKRGFLKIFRFLINRTYFQHPSERFLRISYRHGGLGGDRSRGGQTTTINPVDPGETTVAVDNTGRLPRPPFVLSIGAPARAEYVRVTGINSTTDELTVKRGVRRTKSKDYDEGAEVQYVPADVREATAARAAEMLVMDDDEDFAVPDSGDLTSRGERAKKLRMEWENALAQYSNVMKL